MNFFDCHIIFIPVHLSVHWCLCTVDVVRRRITYYDSMGGQNHNCLTVRVVPLNEIGTFNKLLKQYLSNIALYLQLVLKFMKLRSRKELRRRLIVDEWTLSHAENIAQQGNSCDCGVFLMWYARRICDEEPCYSSEDPMLGRRNKIMNELLQLRVLPDETDEVGTVFPI